MRNIKENNQGRRGSNASYLQAAVKMVALLSLTTLTACASMGPSLHSAEGQRLNQEWGQIFGAMGQGMRQPQNTITPGAPSRPIYNNYYQNTPAKRHPYANPYTGPCNPRINPYCNQGGY